MLKKVKYRSLAKHTQKQLLERDISQRNTPLKSLGFVIDESFFDDFELLYEYGRQLGLQRKDIKLFTFIESRKKTPSLRQNQISNKDFGWDGEINNQNAREFLEYPFDVLVGYYRENNKFMEALVAKSAARFKIGFKEMDQRLYDLLLGVEPYDIDLFKSELKKYLKILKKI